MAFSWMKNLAKRQSSRARATTRGKRYPGREPLALELLEDRIAPSVSAKLNHNVLSVQGTAAGDVIGLRLKVGDPTRLEVLDHGIPIANSAFSTSTFTQITVEAKNGNDTLVIDTSNGSPVPSGGISYDGGSGGGTLVAPNQPDAWSITGPDSGTLNGRISFSHTPNLTGGNAADSFQFAPGGSVSGVINGGTGALSLDVVAGSLTLLGNVVNAGDVTITGGSITLNNNVTISSRRISGTDYLNGPSVGDSGNITLTAPTITVNPGARLLAQVEPGSKYKAGDVTLTADDSEIRLGVEPFGFSLKNTAITLTGATVEGGNVTVKAKATDVNPLDALPPFLQNTLVKPFLQGLVSQLASEVFNFVIPASVMVRGAGATVTVTDTTVVAGRDVKIDATTSVDSSVNAISSVGPLDAGRGTAPIPRFAVAYGYADSEAQTLVGGRTQIQAGRDVGITSNATTTDKVTARVFGNIGFPGVPSNINDAGFSLAVANTHTVSQASLGQGASITAPGGNVTVSSKGTVVSSPKAVAQIFVNGTAGVALGLNLDLTDVHALAAGTIIAAGRSVTSTPLAPSDVNADGTIPLPNHGLHTGDQVVYSSGGGNAIGGLQDGQTYYVLVIDANTIKLTSALGITLDNTAVTPHAQQSLALRDGINFDPSTALNSDGSITLPNHPFRNGSEVTYYSFQADPVTNLTNQGTYYVIVDGPNTIRLANTPQDAQNKVAVPISYSGPSTVNGLAYVHAPVTFDASSSAVVDNLNHVLHLPNNGGFHTGDAVVYHVDPTVSSKQSVALDESFDPNAAVNLASSTITIQAHGLSTGDQVTYQIGYLGETATPIGGLTPGTTYYVIKVDDNTIELAASAADAARGKAIRLGGGATGTLHNLRTTRPISDGDTPLAGLEDGETYYVSVLDANTIRLTETEAEAYAAAPIALDPTMATGSAHAFRPAGAGSGVSVKATLDATDTVIVKGTTGGNPKLNDLTSNLDLAPATEKIFKAYETKDLLKPAKEVMDANPNTFSFGVGLGVNVLLHNVTATAGGTAVLKSAADLKVDAAATQRTQVLVDSATGKDEKGLAVGVSVGVGAYINTVQATAASGAELDALGHVEIASHLVYPFLFDFNKTFTLTDHDPSKAEGAIISAGKDFLLDGKLGVPSRIFNVFVTTKNKGKVDEKNGGSQPTVGLAFSLGFVGYFNDSEAVVAAGTRINQDPAYQNTTQSVSVAATTSLIFLDAAGIINLDLSADSVVKAAYKGDPSEAFSLFGNRAKNGVGGAVLVQILDDTTLAQVQGGAQIHTGTAGSGLSVDAQESLISYELAQSGGQADKIGFTGSLSFVEQTSRTLAEVLAGAVVTGGPLAVTADGFMTHINLAGAVELSRATGIGVSAAVNAVQRDTEAFIGKQGTGSDPSPANAGTSITVTGIDVEARSRGVIGTLSVAGAVVANTDAHGPVEPVGALKGTFTKGSTGSIPDSSLGIGAAGAGSLNTVVDTTLAYIQAGTFSVSGGIKLDSEDVTAIVAIAGAATFVKDSNKAAIGLAGAFASDNLSLTTKSFIAAALIPQVQDVTLNASATGVLFSLSAGFAGTQGTSNGFAGAGSVSLNVIEDDTETFLDGVRLGHATGNVTLDADDGSIIVAIGGGFGVAVGGKLGFGAGVGVNNISGTTLTEILGTSAPSTVNLDGSLSLTATNEKFIEGLGFSIGFGQFAVGGTIGVNAVEDDAEAVIRNATVAASGTVGLTAANSAVISADAGGVGFALALSFKDDKALVTFGAAAAVNVITDTVKATLDGATVTGSGVSLSAGTTAAIGALTFGGALSAGVGPGKGLAGAGAGSISVNLITDTTEAAVENHSAVTAGAGGVSMTASDGATIAGDAGGVAIAIDKGKAISVGASLAINTVSDTTSAAVTGSTVSSTGGVALDAASTAVIQALTISGALSVAAGEGGSAFAGSGAGSANTINDTTSAQVSGGSTVSSGAGQAVRVTASDTSVIVANAGGVSLGGTAGEGKGLGIAGGASVAVNTITNAVTALIDGSTVNSGGAVDVEATEGARIGVLALGVAGTLSGGEGGIGLDGAGSASINVIANTTLAAIQNNSAVTSGFGSGVTVHAADDSTIAAAAGAGALAIVGGEGDGITGTLGFSLSSNTVANTVKAALDRSSLTSGGGLDLSAIAGEQVVSVTAAGAVAGSVGSESDLAFAGAGAVSVNVITNTVTAQVSNTSRVTNHNGRAVSLTAADDALITANAGAIGVAVGGGESGRELALGASVAVNVITDTVSATSDGSTVDAGGDVTLSAVEAAAIVVVTLGVSGAVAGGASGGTSIAGAGSGSGNTTRNRVKAAITGSAVTAGGRLRLQAEDDASITAAAGAGSLAIAAGGGTNTALGLSFSLAVNNILDSTSAIIDSSTVTGAGGVSLDATTAASILAVTVAGTLAGSFGAGTNLAFAGVGAGSINTISNTTEARVTGGSVTTITGAVQVHAADDSSIDANSGAVDVAASGGAGAAGALAAGAAFAVNTITNTTRALLDGTAVTAGGAVDVSATSGANVLAITVGFSGAAGIGSTGVAVAGFGSFSANTVVDTTTAALQHGSRVSTTGGGDVSVRAADDAVIRAVAGAGALAIAGGGGVSVSGVLGFSVAINTVSDGTSAFMDGSTVAASGNVFDEATSAAEIDSVTVAGTAAGSFSAGVGLAFAGAGAGSINTISNTTEARLSGGTVVTAGAGSLLRVHAEDDAHIKADAGALTVGISGGAVLRGVGSFGAAFAADTVTDTARATIDGATASSGGGVEVRTSSGAHVFTVAVGAAGSIAIGSIGVALAGAGSVATNTVSDTAEASVKHGSRVTSANGGAVTVSATDGTAITAGGGAGVLVAAGGPGGGIGFGLGFSVAVNTVTDSACAVVEDATAAGSGGVFVTATSTADIEAVTTAGAGVGTGGAVGGLSFAGAGAGSGNTISNTTEAHLAHSTVSTDSGRFVRVLAADNSSINASAGALGIAIAGGGGGGGAAAAGASMAVNTITNAVRATVDASTVNSGGLDVEATSGGRILAAAVGASGALGIAGGGGVALSGAAAGTGNTIANTLEASVRDGSSVNAGGGAVVLRAIDGASIEAVAGSGALAGAGGATVGLSGAVGIGLSANSVADTVTAFVDAATVSSGRVEVTATSEADITALSLGGAGAIGGAAVVGGALAGAGAGSGNTIADVITATVTGGSVVRATTGAVAITATDHSAIDAGAGGAAFAISGAGAVSVRIAIGASVLVTDIGNRVQAFVDHATVSAAAGVSLTARSTAALTAWSLGSTLAVGGSGAVSVALAAAGSTVTDTIHDTIGAFVQHSAQVTAGGTVALTASDDSSIDAEAAGGSVAIGGAIGGVAGSVSAVAAVNRIDNIVETFIGASGPTVDPTTVTAAGAVSLSAGSTSSMDAFADAASIAGSISIGGSLSGAGADATNNTSNTIAAFLQGDVTVNAAGGLELSATDAASIRAEVASGSLAFGLIGGSLGESLTGNEITDRVTASLGNATVTTAGHDVALNATSSSAVSGRAVGTTLAIALGVSSTGCSATSRNDGTTEASVGNQARLALDGGSLKVGATSASHVSAEADGGAFGVVASGDILSTATADGTTRAFVGEGSTVTAGSVEVSAQAAEEADAETAVVAIGVIGFGGARSQAEVGHNAEAFLGPRAGRASGFNPEAPGATTTITATGGPVVVSARSANKADAEAHGGTGGVFDVGVLIVNAEAGGATNAYVGGNVRLNAAEADVTAQGDDTADSEGFLIGVAVLSASGANMRSNVADDVAAFVAPGSAVSVPSGLLRVRALSSPTSKADSEGIAGGGVAVSVLVTDATIGGSTVAFVGQGDTVTAGALEVTAEAPRSNAEADSFALGVGILGGAGSNTRAETGRDVEAFVGPRAGTPAPGAPTALTIDGAVTIRAADFDLATPAGSGAQARVKATVGAGGFISAGAAVSDAIIDGTTKAYVGDGVLLQGGSLSVQATGADAAIDQAVVGSGGAFTGRGTDTEAHATPTLLAYLGNGVRAAIAGTVDVEATSVHAEGHVRAESYGGGGLDIGIPQATAYSAPTVTAYLGTNTTVLAGGDVTVRAAAHSDPTGTFSDQIQAVNPSTGTITFPSHGLLDGDLVRYAPDDSPTPLRTPAGPLDPSRTYRVVFVTPDTVKLGAGFSAGQLQVLSSLGGVTADPIDPLNPAEGVDSARNVIKFSGPHEFQTGDAVVYETNGNPFVSGQLTNGGTYYVKKIDDYTVKLYPTQAAATAPYRTFDPSGDLSGNTFTFNNQGFRNGDAVTYLAPAPVSFHSTDVHDSITPFFGGSTINLSSTGDLQIGDSVIYETNDTTGTPIGGLVNGHTYEVVSIQGTAIQLADPSVSGLPIGLSPDTSARAASATEELRKLPIRGLQNGVTYYVTNATGSSFQLADTPQHAQVGTALGFSASGASGHHQIGRDGIALAPATGTQDLRLALTGPATNGPTGDGLLAPNGKSLRAVNVPAGSGQSSAKAEGGSGGFIEVSFPDASTSADPTVNAFVAARQVSAGGNVSVAAESFGNIAARADNVGGGFIYVSEAHATTRFGEGDRPNTSRAFVGTRDPATGAVDATGVRIVAGGAFTLSSETRLNADVSSSADGGGFLSFTEADGTSDITSDTTAVVGSNAALEARRVRVTADASTLHAYVNPSSTAGGFIGGADATAESNADSTAAVLIGGGTTRVSGFEGVDVRALNEHFRPDLDPDADFFGLFGSGDTHSHHHNHLHSSIESGAGATVLAGPRPPDSPLQQVAGFGALALFVQAADSNVQHTSEDRTITWNANATILSGPAPELVVDRDGNIVRAVNVSVNDGGVNKTSGRIAGTAVVVNPITGGPGGEVLMQADNRIADGPASPLFDFVDSYDHVRIINLSAKDLVVNAIDVTNRGLAPLVHLDTGDLAFNFDITHTVRPTLIDVENQDRRQRPSRLILAGALENPIGVTRIINARGDVLSAGPSVVRTESLDVEATGSVGTLASRINADLVESVDLATGALRPALITASAGTGNVDLSLTGRRRDNLTSPFTLVVNSLTAGGDVDVVIRDSVKDPGAAGQVGGVTVEAPPQGISGTYLIHFNPDDDPTQRAGLDPGVFADLANATPINSVYDLTRVSAGDDVTVRAGSESTVDLVLGLVTATDTVFLDGTGRVLDTDDAGALDVVAFEFDVRARGGVGTPDNPLETQVRRLHVLAGNGDLWITNPGAMELVTIDVSLTRPSVLHAGSIDTMTVGPDLLVPGDDLAGQLIVDGTLGSLLVAGGTPGTIVAGHIGSVRAYGGYGPLVLQINETGIQRRVEAAVPGMDFPIPPPPPAPIPPTSPPGVLFQYVYESGSLANPQLTVRVTNSTGNADPDQYDLSLVTYNDLAKFNLVRLDAAGVSGIRNVAVEGDVLTSVTSQAANFFKVPGPNNTVIPDGTPAGIHLPLDNLAGVGVRDFVPNASLQAHSIQAVAFGSHAEEDGRVETGAASGAEDAADLLTPDTAIVQANDTYRVPFADLPTQRVALFLATEEKGGHFDNDPILFAVQGVSSPNADATANIVTPSNVARGAATALVTVVPTLDNQGGPDNSVVQSVSLRGDGASIQTKQYIAGSITSTGPLGDLILQDERGITDITGPSIFGSILGKGPITGIVQTTGLRTDPITGVVTKVSADLGRLYVDTTDPYKPSLTSTVVDTKGISGALVSRGDLISQVLLHGGLGLSGIIAVEGNIGKTFTYASGTSVRRGGLLADGGVSGAVVALGTIVGDVQIEAGLRGGRIAAKSGIAGNVTINGGLDAGSAIVSGGEIGDTGLGTQLTVNGENKGILAAEAALYSGKGDLDGAVYNDTGATPQNPNTAAIDAIFTELGQPLALDLSGLDLGGLAFILRDLAALHVGSDGNLAGPTP